MEVARLFGRDAGVMSRGLRLLAERLAEEKELRRRVDRLRREMREDRKGRMQKSKPRHQTDTRWHRFTAKDQNQFRRCRTASQRAVERCRHAAWDLRAHSSYNKRSGAMSGARAGAARSSRNAAVGVAPPSDRPPPIAAGLLQIRPRRCRAHFSVQHELSLRKAAP
jgi:hypothetical protein